MRKRKTKLAQADGCAMRFRSAWKKTPVPAPAAPRKAIRNCVEESSPTSGHGSGKPRASPSRQGQQPLGASSQTAGMSATRGPRRVLLPLAAAALLVVPLGAPLPAGAHAGAAGLAHVTLIGDSVATAIPGDTDAMRVLRMGSDLDLDVAPCRRLVDQSCPPNPPTVVEVIKRLGAAVGPTVVIAVGLQRFRGPLRERDRRHARRARRRVREAHLLVDDARSSPSVHQHERRDQRCCREPPEHERHRLERLLAQPSRMVPGRRHPSALSRGRGRWRA